MKTEIQTKEFDAVKMMREIRDKISKEIADMTFSELKEYFKKRKESYTANSTLGNK